MQQRFTKLKNKTNILSGDVAVKNVTVPDVLNVEAVKLNLTKVEQTKQPVTDKLALVTNEVQPVKIAQPKIVDKPINIICNNSQIVRRNNANKLEINCYAVMALILTSSTRPFSHPKDRNIWQAWQSC